MMDFRAGLLRYLSEQQLQAIEAQIIGIAGAGGLGSNLAMLLVRCGFRKFILTDFDEVAVSNLNRQNYFLAQSGKPKLAALEEIKQNTAFCKKLERVDETLYDLKVNGIKLK